MPTVLCKYFLNYLFPGRLHPVPLAIPRSRVKES